MTGVHLEILADHTALRETHTYDVACIRFRAVDENGNLLNYYNDPLVLELEGDAELIGPAVVGLNGGMGGTYVRTVGKGGAVGILTGKPDTAADGARTGKAVLKVSDAFGNVLGNVEFNIELM